MIDFFEFSNEMLCLANQQGYLTRVNAAWTRTLGWSAEELTGRPYLDFVHPDDVAATIQASLLRNGNHGDCLVWLTIVAATDRTVGWQRSDDRHEFR